MRHFKKIDWSISLSLLFACVLTVIAACVESSGPLGARNNVVYVGAVSSVRINLALATLAPGQTTQATVIATSADGNVVGGLVDFSSQNPSVATVSSKGVVTAVAAGITAIQAAVAGFGAKAPVTVKSLAPSVALVAVALDSTSLAIGHSAKASATAKDSAGNLITGQTVTWSSLSPAVATVASTGTVTAVAAGSATIQGTVSGKAGSASLTVIKVPASPVAVVAVQVDSTTLLVGHVAHASATAKDAMGNLITGQVFTWASLTPGIATISSLGAVTAVAAGTAVIQASVSGITGLDTLVVVVPPDLAFSNFSTGTPTPFNDYGSTSITYPADPTGSGRGKVARVLYTGPAADPGSSDQNIEFLTAHHYRYGETIWFKGDVYFPSAVVSGGPQNYNDTRKMVDYFQGQTCRVILERTNGLLYWFAGDAMTGTYHEDVYFGSTGITLNDDTWYTIELRVTMNSADNVRDGILEIYINGSVKPSYSVTTGLGWITEQKGGTYFNSFRFGTQLTIHYPTDPQYSQYRYWDKVGFSTTRIGR